MRSSHDHLFPVGQCCVYPGNWGVYVCSGCGEVVWCGVVQVIVGGGVVCGVTSDVNQFQMSPTPRLGCESNVRRVKKVPVVALALPQR